MTEKIADLLEKVKLKSPLVLNITNYVAMNNSANAVLAVGGSPIMSKASEEMDDLSKICDSLVVNIGTLEKESIEAMFVAVEAFGKANKPIVLDPVGAGASSFRNNTIKKILSTKYVKYIRGNGSEIIAVAGFENNTKGVDSTNTSAEALKSAQILSKQLDCVVCISGEVDIVVKGEKIAYINNGAKLMTKVTALGCSASAVLGVFSGLNEDPFDCAIAACSVMSLAGELSIKNSAGPGSLQVNFLDQLYTLDRNSIKKHLKVNIK